MTLCMLTERDEDCEDSATKRPMSLFELTALLILVAVVVGLSWILPQWATALLGGVLVGLLVASLIT